MCINFFKKGSQIDAEEGSTKAEEDIEKVEEVDTVSQEYLDSLPERNGQIHFRCVKFGKTQSG